MVISFRNKKVVDINDKLKIIKLTEQEYSSLLEVEKDILSKTRDTSLIINDKTINTVVAFGKVNSDTDGFSLFELIHELIPFETLPSKDKKVHRSYKCFAGITGIKSNIIPHEDVGSSYNCLIEFLNYPQYVLVYN